MSKFLTLTRSFNPALVRAGLVSPRYLSAFSIDPEQHEKFRKTIAEKAKTTDSETIDKLVAATAPFYHQHRDLEGKKVMVLFSGGLDTSFMTHFLQHVIGADVTTFSANVSSVTDPVNMKEISDRSKEIGATEHAEADCRDFFSRLYLGAIIAEATLGRFGHHPASSLSRVAICEAAVRYAKEHEIPALIHGSNGSQNNPYRFASAIKHYSDLYDHPIEELTPNLGGTTVARDIEALHLTTMGISLKSKSDEKNISHDRTGGGDEWEEDFLANPANEYDVRTTALADAKAPPSPKQRIAIRFKDGKPIAIKTGEEEGFVEKDLAEIMDDLNAIGLKYHIGIYDYPESRPIGINAREVHIGPASDILIKSHNWLRSHVLDQKANIAYDHLSVDWSNIVMQDNFYLSPEREEIDSLLTAVNRDITGDVHMTLEQGLITNVTSPHADKRMEGKFESATKDFVKRHVREGVDEFTKERIAIAKRQLESRERPDTLTEKPKSVEKVQIESLERY